MNAWTLHGEPPYHVNVVRAPVKVHLPDPPGPAGWLTIPEIGQYIINSTEGWWDATVLGDKPTRSDQRCRPKGPLGTPPVPFCGKPVEA